MSDLLDQSEVNALLSAISAGEKGEPGSVMGAEEVHQEIFSSHERRTPPEIRPYDFHHPERVSQDQMRALHQLHEAFARNFGASLSGFLRTIVEVQVSGVEQLAYSEFINGLPNPTSFNLLNCAPLDGLMCLEISPMIIYPVIDRLLGGSSEDVFIPQRPLTQIEQRLVGKITDRAIEALNDAWANVVPLKSTLNQTESNPQLVQIVPPNEVVVVVSFELKMSHRSGSTSLCIPYNVIEPVMEKLSSQGWYKGGARDQVLRDRLGSKLQRATVVASAILAETHLTVRDLVNMTVGDLIVTDKNSEFPVVLAVEGQKKYLANLGQFKGHRAMRIRRRIEPKDRV